MNEAEDINEGGSMADHWPSVIRGENSRVDEGGNIAGEQTGP